MSNNFEQTHSGADRAGVTHYAVAMSFVYTVSFDKLCTADAGSSNSAGLQLLLRQEEHKVSRLQMLL